MHRALSIALTLALAPAALRAQCRPDKDSNEAGLLAYYAAPLAFSPSAMSQPMVRGEMWVVVDGAWIPKPDDQLTSTSACYQAKRENTQLSSIFPRVRLMVGLPAGLVLEGMYLPPLTVGDARANLGSVALGWMRPAGDRFGYTARVHATFGTVEGPITCPEKSLQGVSSTLPCFGTHQSKDAYQPNVVGVEGGIFWRPSLKWSTQFALGYASLRPRFKVGFQPTGAPFDSTRVEVDLTRLSASAGARYAIKPWAMLVAELYSVPGDVTLFRLGMGFRFR